MKTELHIHSTFSDGALTPKEIVKEASAKGVRILSITDHDAIGAYHTALPEAEHVGISLVPGIELNTDGIDGELHILGYCFDPQHPKMTEHIYWRTKQRNNWAAKIVSQLNDLGYAISLADVRRHVPGDVIVRTHIAAELVRQGYFPTADDAYQALLKKGKPAFVERVAFSAEKAIQLVHECGGKAFLAHPAIYRSSVPLQRLLSYGLDGIEVYHSEHSDEDSVYWLEVTKQYGLLVSGGSDYHGTSARKKKEIAIGSVQLDTDSKNYWIKRAEES
ncbi:MULTISPECIES: PHP domain-containing protein [Virgibacillus]|uniref:Polymerase/histidinol phosphatase N-terminal domain-containing protein n=1 Tax=Virgibacillus dokdonensis TaxID=302167 RepID=A0A2K9IWR9_9BACI|nr:MULTISPECIES: PHP domain-containing protein [Virgibacillus]AUJ24209.1 hypothetical protein A21D_01097 [Virgibacillus dokdonensis]NWO12425.1 PHP domain-containing protein [Virgibacillus sp.]